MTVRTFFGVGKRKTAIARVMLREGTGQIEINKRTMTDYFKRPTSRMVIEQALHLTQMMGRVDIRINVLGGGLSGQAGAIRHGITRALMELNPELRPVLKKAGFVTRDARKKERKMYGLAAARARFQFSKR